MKVRKNMIAIMLHCSVILFHNAFYALHPPSMPCPVSLIGNPSAGFGVDLGLSGSRIGNLDQNEQSFI